MEHRPSTWAFVWIFSNPKSWEGEGVFPTPSITQSLHTGTHAHIHTLILAGRWLRHLPLQVSAFSLCLVVERCYGVCH